MHTCHYHNEFEKSKSTILPLLEVIGNVNDNQKHITNNEIKLLQFDSMILEGSSGSLLIHLQTNQINGIATNRFNPNLGGGSIMMGNRYAGVETNISYATIIENGMELLKNEK